MEIIVLLSASAEFVRILVWGGEGEGWREVRDKETKSVVIRANSDTHSKVEILLEEFVMTKMVRIVPVSKHPRMVCLRVELLGCELQGNGILILLQIYCHLFYWSNTFEHQYFRQPRQQH